MKKQVKRESLDRGSIDHLRKLIDVLEASVYEHETASGIKSVTHAEIVLEDAADQVLLFASVIRVRALRALGCDP